MQKEPKEICELCNKAKTEWFCIDCGYSVCGGNDCNEEHGKCINCAPDLMDMDIYRDEERKFKAQSYANGYIHGEKFTKKEFSKDLENMLDGGKPLGELIKRKIRQLNN